MVFHEEIVMRATLYQWLPVKYSIFSVRFTHWLHAKCNKLQSSRGCDGKPGVHFVAFQIPVLSPSFPLCFVTWKVVYMKTKASLKLSSDLYNHYTTTKAITWSFYHLVIIVISCLCWLCSLLIVNTILMTSVTNFYLGSLDFIPWCCLMSLSFISLLCYLVRTWPVYLPDSGRPNIALDNP